MYNVSELREFKARRLGLWPAVEHCDVDDPHLNFIIMQGRPLKVAANQGINQEILNVTSSPLIDLTLYFMLSKVLMRVTWTKTQLLYIVNETVFGFKSVYLCFYKQAERRFGHFTYPIRLRQTLCRLHIIIIIFLGTLSEKPDGPLDGRSSLLAICDTSGSPLVPTMLLRCQLWDITS